ncbi:MULTISPECIES: hypothetical protein [Neorhizobium]|jgi:hypothetical protein|uniref:hypothetical protein n=1 Tax=Neorhizobium TaxID=1525371 RepID=UPI000CF8AAEE|nr:MULTISPECIES: hypothetical protein [Neorhizobium]
MTIFMGPNAIKAFSGQAAGQPYSLTVLNENAKWQQFALFQTIPKIIGPSVDPLSLAWMVGGAAAGTPDNPSTSSFNWTIDYSVTVGYIQEQGSPSSPRSFQTASSVSVMINNQNYVPVTYQGPFPYGAPGFPEGTSDSTKGLILAQADGTIPTVPVQASKSVYLSVGIAMADKPTIAVQLEPGLLYQFTPKPKYYILAGSFVQGQVIDTATSSAAYEVNFAGVTDVSVRFTQQNQFVPA